MFQPWPVQARVAVEQDEQVEQMGQVEQVTLCLYLSLLVLGEVEVCSFPYLSAVVVEALGLCLYLSPSRLKLWYLATVHFPSQPLLAAKSAAVASLPGQLRWLGILQHRHRGCHPV